MIHILATADRPTILSFRQSFQIFVIIKVGSAEETLVYKYSKFEFSFPFTVFTFLKSVLLSFCVTGS